MACFILLFREVQYHSVTPVVFPEHLPVYSVHIQ